MNNTLFNDEQTGNALHFGVRGLPVVSERPFIILIMILVILFVCEATIMAAIHLLPISNRWATILDPILLVLLNSMVLYRFFVSPMNKLLKTNKEVAGKLDLFRGLIDKSNDAIFVIESETGKILDVNYKACITLCYTRAELRNITMLHIEENITNETAWSQYSGKVRNNGYAFLSGRHKRKDGTSFPVETNANLINWGGRDYMVAVARDITEREHAQVQIKDSEAKFRKLAECAKDAIIMMGPKGEISFWNPAAEKIFGYCADEAMGKNLHEMLVPERFRNAFQKGFSGFQKTGTGNAAGKTLKLAALRKDGGEFSIELSVSPVRLNGIWHSVGIVRDTSQRMEIEADFAVLSSEGK